MKCDACGKETGIEPDGPPPEIDGAEAKWLCFGCAVGFAGHELAAGREYPYATQTTLDDSTRGVE